MEEVISPESNVKGEFVPFTIRSKDIETLENLVKKFNLSNSKAPIAKNIIDRLKSPHNEEARFLIMDQMINIINPSVALFYALWQLYSTYIFDLIEKNVVYNQLKPLLIKRTLNFFYKYLEGKSLFEVDFDVVDKNIREYLYHLSEVEIVNIGFELSDLQKDTLRAIGGKDYADTQDSIIENIEELYRLRPESERYGLGSQYYEYDSTLQKFSKLWRYNIITAVGFDITYKLKELGFSDENIKTLIKDLPDFLKNRPFEEMELKDVILYTRDFSDEIIGLVFGESSTRSKVQIGNAEDVNSRKLNDEQMAELLDFEYAGKFVGLTDVVERRVKKNLKKQLRDLEIEPKFLSQLRYQIKLRFERSFIHPGARVGLIAAQALGEQATQAGLRAFHHAGISSDSGFERIEAVTNCSTSPKNTFTYIALKESYTYREARIIASKIEYTSIASLLENEDSIFVGRTKPAANPDDDNDIFGGSASIAIYPAQPWHKVFIKIMSIKDQSFRGNVDKEWVVRLKLKSDALFQKRISMSMIAETIESLRSDLRVVYSNISIGIIDVFTSAAAPQDIQGSPAYRSYFQHIAIKNDLLKLEMKVQGTPGFSKAIVERLNIANFINKIIHQGTTDKLLDESPSVGDLNVIIVEFAIEDVLMAGIPDNHIKRFLAFKAGLSVDADQDEIDQYVGVTEDHDFIVLTGLAATKDKGKNSLEYKILTEETVRLGINSKEYAEGDKLIVILNSNTLNNIENVPVQKLLDFFLKQNEIPRFAYASIFFNRSKFEVEIEYDKRFNPQKIFDDFMKFLYAEKGIKASDKDFSTSFDKDSFTITIDTSNDKYDEKLISDFIKPYGDILRYEILDTESDNFDIKFTLSSGTLNDIWNELKTSLFTSEKRESLAHRYRILARGNGMKYLAEIPQIDINGTISSWTREIVDRLGIEAGRAQIFAEIKLNGGSAVSERHIAMLADVMSFIGELAPMTLGGKQLIKAGVLATVAMQQSFSMFIEAAMAGARDPLRSSVAQTLLGDFERNEIGRNADFKSKDEGTDSAIDMLMSATIATSKPKTKAKRQMIYGSNVTLDDKVKATKEFDKNAAKEINEFLDMNY